MPYADFPRRKLTFLLSGVWTKRSKKNLYAFLYCLFCSSDTMWVSEILRRVSSGTGSGDIFFSTGNGALTDSTAGSSRTGIIPTKFFSGDWTVSGLCTFLVEFADCICNWLIKPSSWPSINWASVWRSSILIRAGKGSMPAVLKILPRAPCNWAYARPWFIFADKAITWLRITSCSLPAKAFFAAW